MRRTMLRVAAISLVAPVVLFACQSWGDVQSSIESADTVKLAHSVTLSKANVQSMSVFGENQQVYRSDALQSAYAPASEAAAAAVSEQYPDKQTQIIDKTFDQHRSVQGSAIFVQVFFTYNAEPTGANADAPGQLSHSVQAYFVKNGERVQRTTTPQVIGTGFEAVSESQASRIEGEYLNGEALAEVVQEVWSPADVQELARKAVKQMLTKAMNA